jgi:parallel beta-helix repeat protein
MVRKIKAKAKISVVVSITLLVSFLSIFFFSTGVKSQESYTPITDCTTITSPGEYRLVNDIIDSSASTCIDIQANNVILDCQWHIIDGVDAGYTYGIWVGGSDVTVNNCIVRDWETGILVFIKSYNTFSNIVANSNKRGIVFIYSGYNTLTNITASYNGDVGIWLRWSGSNILTNVTATNNPNVGIWVDESDNVTISGAIIKQNLNGIFSRYSSYIVVRDSIFQDNIGSGIYLFATNNLIYNNLINGSVLVFWSHYWNTTLQPGTNIWNPSLGYIGGNLWTNPSNTGYSDTCVDANYDGFCDEPYDLLGDGSNIDYLPIAKYVGQNAPAPPPAPSYTEITDCTTITSPGEYRLVNDLQLGGYPYCLDIFSNDVIIDCQGYKIQDYTGLHQYPDGINIRQNVANVTVKNCDIRGFAGEAGVFLRGSNSMIRIYNTSVIDSKIGIIGDGNDIVLYNISTNNVQNPLWLDPVSNLKILNSKISATSNSRINGTNVEIANNEFRYVNVMVTNDLFLTNSLVYGNTIYAINDNYNGVVLAGFFLGGVNIDVYFNSLYSTNTSIVAPTNRSFVLFFVRYEAYNVGFYDNVGYAEYPNGVIIGGVSAFSPNAENIYTYNNYIESTGLLCIQAVRGNNQYIYNNTILDGCIAVFGSVSNTYIYDNLFSLFLISSFGNPINNMFAYNNTIFGNASLMPGVKILYRDLDFGDRLIGSNIFHPETNTLSPYLSLVLNYTSINYGTTIPFNSYDFVGGITIDTNMIDYKIEIDSTDLVSGANSISKNNLSFGFSKTLDFSYLITPYNTITILKQNLQDMFNILTRLYVPLVPPGSYTGTITITVSHGLSGNQIPNPHGGADVEMV